MKSKPLRLIPLLPRILLTVLWAALCAAFLGAPLLEASGHFRAAAILYAFFSPICHQDPARSFTLSGCQWAVCHRCSGIYFGLLLASLLPFKLTALVDQPRRRRLWVLCATIPLLLDVFMPLAGFWTNTPVSRFATGLIFGAMLSSLLVPAVGDFIREARWKRQNLRANALGGSS